MVGDKETNLAIAIVAEAKKKIVLLTEKNGYFSSFKRFISRFSNSKEDYWGGKEIYCELAVSVAATASVTGYQFDEGISVFNSKGVSGKATTQALHRLLDLLRKEMIPTRFQNVFSSTYHATTTSSGIATAALFLALDTRPVTSPSDWKQIFADAAGFDPDLGDCTSDAQIAGEQHYAPARVRTPLFECSDTANDPDRKRRLGRVQRNVRKFRQHYKHIADAVTTPAPVQPTKKEPAMRLAIGA